METINKQGWTKLSGKVNEIKVTLSNPTKINWVVAIPTALGITKVTDAGEELMGYSNKIVRTTDGVEYLVITQDDATKNFDYILK